MLSVITSIGGGIRARRPAGCVFMDIIPAASPKFPLNLRRLPE
jgi:hypothetical protein